MSHEKEPRSYRLVVQPDDGAESILELIAAAKKTLRTTQFTLDDPRFVDAIMAANKRGVKAQVMLNPHKSSGERANDETFNRLKRARVAVEWTNPRFPVTHQKSLLIDDRLGLIATFNLSEKYFGETRDHGLVTDNPIHLATMVKAFEADWNRAEFNPDPSSDLIWSPDNSRRRVAEFIDEARHQLDIQHPKFVDAPIVDRISAARARGVHVRLLCGGKHGLSPWDVADTFSSLRMLERCEVKVRRQKHLKLHAKLVLADGKRALLGSMNIDRSAFDVRRELGVVIDDEKIVERLGELFEHDWHRAEHYVPPDPLALETHDVGELPHDPKFLHE
jgi:cardiolipin synthase